MPNAEVSTAAAGRTGLPTTTLADGYLTAARMCSTEMLCRANTRGRCDALGANRSGMPMRRHRWIRRTCSVASRASSNSESVDASNVVVRYPANGYRGQSARRPWTGSLTVTANVGRV